jgi:hypothetical protein
MTLGVVQERGTGKLQTSEVSSGLHSVLGVTVGFGPKGIIPIMVKGEAEINGVR